MGQKLFLFLPCHGRAHAEADLQLDAARLSCVQPVRRPRSIDLLSRRWTKHIAELNVCCRHTSAGEHRQTLEQYEYTTRPERTSPWFLSNSSGGRAPGRGGGGGGAEGRDVGCRCASDFLCLMSLDGVSSRCGTPSSPLPSYIFLARFRIQFSQISISRL